MATQDVECRKTATAMSRSLERVVRPAPTERTNGNQCGLRRGNDGSCRREDSGPLGRGNGSVRKGNGPLGNDSGPLGRGGGPVRKGSGPVRNDGGTVRKGSGPPGKGSGLVRNGSGLVRNNGGPLDCEGGPVRREGGLVRNDERLRA